MTFPVDVQRALYKPNGYFRGLMQNFWGDWTVIFPWSLRIRLWNWTWELEGDARVKR